MDPKLETFLTLCRVMNYRMAAEELHLTQPAVTKQIQALEREYGVRLFQYDGRRLHRTEAAETLRAHCESLRYQHEELLSALHPPRVRPLRVGATKTIGDYVLSPWIRRHLAAGGELSLTVDNTRALLRALSDGELDFAVIEGYFKKSAFGHGLLRREPFVGVCAAGHPLAGRSVTVERLTRETLIVREAGSGTRDILERELSGAGYDLSDFARVVYISSFKLIRELVAEGLGVTFAYAALLRDDEALTSFAVEGFQGEHEFNVVYLKHTGAEKYAADFFGGGE